MTKKNRENPLMLSVNEEVAAVISAVTVPLAAGNHYLFCQQEVGSQEANTCPGPGTAPQPFAKGQLK